jgi:hypothetical protein
MDYLWCKLYLLKNGGYVRDGYLWVDSYQREAYCGRFLGWIGYGTKVVVLIVIVSSIDQVFIVFIRGC